MIEFSGVTKYYDQDIVLKDVSVNIDKAEMVFLTGPSGAGKTTLLKLIYCSEKPDEGHIVVAGWDIRKLKQRTIPFLRRNLGIVFQDFRLLRNKTVFENVALALRIHDIHPDEIKEDVHEVLKDVKLAHKSNTYPEHLSGGEQQRIVIARAMVTKPTVLLADEPTGNLDSETSDTIMNLFRDINTRGTTVLIATHNESLFRNTGCRVLYLKDSQIERELIG
jgi:cell division transport system ATP-binding protein